MLSKENISKILNTIDELHTTSDKKQALKDFYELVKSSNIYLKEIKDLKQEIQELKLLVINKIK